MTDWADIEADDICRHRQSIFGIATALRAARAMGWQTIDSAPKDAWVLVWYNDGMEASIAMQHDDGSWHDWDGDMYRPPSHWMPPPGPPQLQPPTPGKGDET